MKTGTAQSTTSTTTTMTGAQIVWAVLEREGVTAAVLRSLKQ